MLLHYATILRVFSNSIDCVYHTKLKNSFLLKHVYYFLLLSLIYYFIPYNLYTGSISYLLEHLCSYF